MVEVRIVPPFILFTCPVEVGDRAANISTSCKFDKRSKAFKAPFGMPQMVNLYKNFTDVKIVIGQEYIDRLKDQNANYHQAKSHYTDVSAGNITPKEFDYNFKLPPFTHQLEALHYLEDWDGAALFMDCGCLAGDSLVRFNRGGKGFSCSIKDAYLRFNQLDKRLYNNWSSSIPTRVRSFNGEKIKLNGIQKIVESGIKGVWELKLHDGHTIKATADHEIMTSRGWVELGKLSQFDKVMIDTLRAEAKKKAKEGLPNKVRVGDKRRAVGKGHPFARWQANKQNGSGSFLVEEHRLIYEAYHCGLELEEFIRRTYSCEIKGLLFINPKIYDIHHIDLDHYNNSPLNLRCMTRQSHKELHAPKNTSNFNQGVPKFSQVRSITYIGEEMTYDIVCDDPHRNFVANGIVVHNSGKTATSIWDIDMKYRSNKIRKSSVLVIGKLMTLYSGWFEDCDEFADLSADVLWQSSKTKIVKGDKQILGNYGPKPTGKGKTYEKTKYFFKNSDKEAVLSSPSKFNSRKHERKMLSWKQVGDIKYGEETLTTVSIHNIRSENIRAQITSNEYDVHIINHEGVLGFEKELTERNYDYIIVDESTVLKNPKGKIYAALLRVAKNSKYRRILSGTPSPQGPQDLWSQFFFLDNGLTLGASFKEFMDYAFNMVTLGSQERGTFSGVMPVIRKHGADGKIGTIEYVNSRLRNRIYRCKLRDCVDLPPLTFRKLDVFLDDETQKHYDKMKEELFIELKDKKIEVTIDLAKIMKLRQITSGFIIDKEGNINKTSKRNAKMEVFENFISEIDPTEKVVIFAVYKEEIRSLLLKLGKEAVSIYGDTSAKNKLENQKRFVNDPSVRYIICQPSSAAYGVNKLTVARYLVFYSIDYRADTMYQAIKRIERTGQLRNMFVLYLCAKGTIDSDILKKVDTKRLVQQETIDVDQSKLELSIVADFRKER